jgi:hypothetical protein
MSTTTYTFNDPVFIADNATVINTDGAQVDWAKVPDSYRNGAFTVTATADAIATATAITVAALPGDVSAGTLLYFGTGKLAKVTTNAVAGATSLVVEALVAQVDDTDEAIVGGTGYKKIQAGTIMAQLSSGKVIPRAAVTGSETSTSILETSASEDDLTHGGYGQLVGGVIYQNLLPDFTNASWASTWRGEITATAVGHFVFQTYADDRS